jgi:hypothetical protein
MILEEQIGPENIVTDKPKRHRMFLEKWPNDSGSDPDPVWLAREACI